MTARLRRVAFRTSGILLVLLAVLPFTAPFSTLDLATLLGDEHGESGVPAESKPASLEWAPTAGVVPAWRDLPDARASTSPDGSAPLPPGSFVVPLRL